MIDVWKELSAHGLTHSHTESCTMPTHNITKLNCTHETYTTHPYTQIKSSNREGKPFKPPLPCGHTHSWERLQEYTSRKNPELESLRRLNVILGILSATPAANLTPYVMLAFPWVQSAWPRGGSCCLGSARSPYLPPRPAPWRGHSGLTSRWSIE
jgi:hypothetical protein